MQVLPLLEDMAGQELRSAKLEPYDYHVDLIAIMFILF